MLLFAVASNAFVVNIGHKLRSSFAAMASLNDSVKKGDSDVIRGRLKKMSEAKRQAAGILAPLKKSLSLELEEMADEIDDTTEEYGQYLLITYPYPVSVIHNDSYNHSFSYFVSHVPFVTRSLVKFASLAAICAKNGMKLNKADMPDPVDDDDEGPSTLRYASVVCDMV